MGESPAHDHEQAHDHGAAGSPFRFETFADAAAAQAAFAAAYPPGSPVEPALQALLDMGAQCKAVTPGTIVCRYVENTGVLAGWCWHIALERSNENALKQVRIEAAMTGI